MVAAIGGCQPYDPGGDIRGRIAQALTARQHEAAAEIRGGCYSACALKLASGKNLCLARDAVVGVHEVRQAPPGNYATGIRDVFFTGFFEGMLPPCIASLLAARRAFDSGQIVTVSGQDILNACPQFAACAA